MWSWAGVAAAVSVLGAMVALAGVAGGMAGAAACWTARLLIRQQLAVRRRRQAVTDIVAAVTGLGRELHAGADPAVAADNSRSVARGQGAEVLGALAQSMRADDHRGMVTTDWFPAGSALLRLRMGWLLSRRHGIAFTPLIDGLAAELTEVLASDSRRAGEVAGPRVSAYVMAALPVMGLLLGSGMGADPVGVLLGSTVGRVLLVVGVLLTCAGLLWSARIAAS